MHLDPAPQKSGITDHTCPVSGAGSNWVNGTEGPPLAESCGKPCKMPRCAAVRPGSARMRVPGTQRFRLASLTSTQSSLSRFTQSLTFSASKLLSCVPAGGKKIRRGENHAQMVWLAACRFNGGNACAAGFRTNAEGKQNLCVEGRAYVRRQEQHVVNSRPGCRHARKNCWCRR